MSRSAVGSEAAAEHDFEVDATMSRAHPTGGNPSSSGSVSDDDEDSVLTDPSKEQLASIRSCWELASLSQFFRLLAPLIKIPPLTTSELERHLLRPSLTRALLPTLLGGKHAKATPAAAWLEVCARSRRGELPAPFDEPGSLDVSVSALAPTQRAALLLSLAHAALDESAALTPSLRGANANVDADSLRQEVLGRDGEGGIYSQMGDGRLYREQPISKAKRAAAAKKAAKEKAAAEKAGKGGAKKAGKGSAAKTPGNAVAAPPAKSPVVKEGGSGRAREPDTWETVAVGAAEWHSFASGLKKRGLESKLRASVLRCVAAVEEAEAVEARDEAKERKRQATEALMAAPKRGSGRLAVMQSGREEEERAAARYRYMRT